MGTTLEICSIEYDLSFRSHGHKITFTQIGNSIYDDDLIEPLMEISRQNYWYLESECGFTGELLGKDIIAIFKKYKGEESKNTKFILENLKGKEEEFFRISLSF